MPKYMIKNGQFYEVPNDTLVHWGVKKGQPRKDHKYVKREWKNGHWVYYYDENSFTTEPPKGMNYKTEKQVVEETKAAEANKAAKAAKEKEKADREDRVWSKIERAIDKGKERLIKIEYFFSTPISKMPEYIRWATRDETE